VYRKQETQNRNHRSRHLSPNLEAANIRTQASFFLNSPATGGTWDSYERHNFAIPAWLGLDRWTWGLDWSHASDQDNPLLAAGTV